MIVNIEMEIEDARALEIAMEAARKCNLWSDKVHAIDVGLSDIRAALAVGESWKPIQEARLVAMEIENRTLRFSTDYLLSKIEATEENKKKLNDANTMDVQSFADAQVAKERERAEWLVKALKSFDRWWRLPSSQRTIATIEPAMRECIEALSKYQEEGE